MMMTVALARRRDVGALDVGAEAVDEADGSAFDAFRHAFPNGEEDQTQRRHKPQHDGQGREGCYHDATRSSCERLRIS